MNREVAIDSARAQIELRLVGLVGGAEFAWGIQQIESACRQQRVENAVWDLRKADLSQLSFAVIRGTVEDWPSPALPDDARIAVVAGGELDQILLQLWREAGYHRDKRQRQIFLNIEQARAWAAGE